MAFDDGEVTALLIGELGRDVIRFAEQPARRLGVLRLDGPAERGGEEDGEERPAVAAEEIEKENHASPRFEKFDVSNASPRLES